MFVKLGLILLAARWGGADKEDQEWDLAVAINDQVELLNSNGTLIGAAMQQFTQLKALAFDSVRHQFVVSDMDQQNDTIYSVQLTKQTDIMPIVEDLLDDIQGLAIDPVTDVLFWTDALNRTINYISLNDSEPVSKTLFEFDDKVPQNIAIDVCRRYLYWTNADMINPSIERSALDGTDHNILVSDDLFMPTGITVDHLSQRIYWTDMREGIYYRIESVSFDGSDRKVVFEGTHQRPSGIAVDKESVYWTDVNNNALWRKKKEASDKPEVLRSFKERPTGLVVHNPGFRFASECETLQVQLIDVEPKEYFDRVTEGESEGNEFSECLNGGQKVNGTCKCPRGFTGVSCETALCYNLCFRGNCHYSTLGSPQCHCPSGYTGVRCERNICDSFCMNGGKCYHAITNRTEVPSCDCPIGFRGRRCEISSDFTQVCNLFCETRSTDILVDKKHSIICRCDEGIDNVAAYELRSSEVPTSLSLIDHLTDPIFITQSVCMLVMTCVIVALAVTVCRLRRRPRIKKRYIVNKSVTPLTYRPQATTEQCEITIENCCNMNVCETPCFDPPQLRGFSRTPKEDKKTLLANMENGDDLY